MDIKKIINTYGTPSFVFDIDALTKRIAYLKSKLSFDLVYAVKANSFIVKDLKDLVLRYEICSPGEYEICEKLGIPEGMMVISGVYKEEKVIEEMIKNKDILKYTVESMNQFILLDKLATKYQKKIHLLLRLTSNNQFGMTKEEIKYIIENHKRDYLIIDGLEYFSGTQKHNLNLINKEIDRINEFILDIENNLHFPINELEYGPGAPVYYFQDNEFLEDEFLDNLNNSLKKINKKVTLEIGRSIAASCGTYLTKVVDLKTNKSGDFAILDGGINHLVYYGQMMAMKVPYFDLIKEKEENEDIIYNLCGSLCTINDIIVKNLTLKKLNIGDVFAFKNVGAYSITEGIALFLSRDLPKVILYKNNKCYLVRDTYKTSNLNFPNVEE